MWVTIAFQTFALTGGETCTAIEGLQPTGENVHAYVRVMAGDRQMRRKVVGEGNCTYKFRIRLMISI